MVVLCVRFGQVWDSLSSDTLLKTRATCRQHINAFTHTLPLAKIIIVIIITIILPNIKLQRQLEDARYIVHTGQTLQPRVHL